MVALPRPVPAPRPVRIAATGKFLPARQVTAAEMDAALGARPGWTLKKAGVEVRHFAEHETPSQMGAEAARRALEEGGYSLADIDAIVGTSATMEQAIPCTAALIQRELGDEASGIPCFDIDSTCLSFVVGLDLVSHLVAASAYRRVLVVATEIASVGLDWSHKESCALFGDGAAAAIVERSGTSDASSILASRVETYSDGAHLAQVQLGTLATRGQESLDRNAWQFQMQGKALFKMARKLLPGFLERLLAPVGVSLSDIDLVIPHQGSRLAMRMIQKQLDIPDERYYMFVRDHGNTIAASIPMGLHNAMREGRVGRGDLVLLCGTSAGFSLGGALLRL